jgi:hypothetical protein
VLLTRASEPTKADCAVASSFWRPKPPTDTGSGMRSRMASQ